MASQKFKTDIFNKFQIYMSSKMNTKIYYKYSYVKSAKVAHLLTIIIIIKLKIKYSDNCIFIDLNLKFSAIYMCIYI